jgi:hypothetical protein
VVSASNLQAAVVEANNMLSAHAEQTLERAEEIARTAASSTANESVIAAIIAFEPTLEKIRSQEAETIKARVEKEEERLIAEAVAKTKAIATERGQAATDMAIKTARQVARDLLADAEGPEVPRLVATAKRLSGTARGQAAKVRGLTQSAKTLADEAARLAEGVASFPCERPGCGTAPTSPPVVVHTRAPGTQAPTAQAAVSSTTSAPVSPLPGFAAAAVSSTTSAPVSPLPGFAAAPTTTAGTKFANIATASGFLQTRTEAPPSGPVEALARVSTALRERWATQTAESKAQESSIASLSKRLQDLRVLASERAAHSHEILEFFQR